MRPKAPGNSGPGKVKKLFAPDGPEGLRGFGVSRETVERLEIYAALLRKWQRTINLVAASTLDEIWTRHFADSLQVSEALPSAKLWMDLGSGAGFPGLVTAIRLVGADGARVHLVESDQRKCAFLRDVSRETGAPVEIHNERIEQLLPSFTAPVEAVSARALAPLDTLVHLSEKLLENGAVGVFPQGQRARIELTDSRLTGRFNIEERPSSVSFGSRIAIVTAKSRL